MTTQFVKFALVIFPIGLLWICLLFDCCLPFRLSPTTKWKYVFPFPLYAAFALAVYAIVSIVYGVMMFNDCEEASKELRKEIEEARYDLRRRGMSLDNS